MKLSGSNITLNFLFSLLYIMLHNQTLKNINLYSKKSKSLKFWIFTFMFITLKNLNKAWNYFFLIYICGVNLKWLKFFTLVLIEWDYLSIDWIWCNRTINYGTLKCCWSHGLKVILHSTSIRKNYIIES